MNLILKADVIVAEVTTASLGVGYEVGRCVENKKIVLALYRSQEGKKLSAMIAGCRNISIVKYNSLEEAKTAIDRFFEKMANPNPQKLFLANKILTQKNPNSKTVIE